MCVMVKNDSLMMIDDGLFVLCVVIMEVLSK